MELKAETGHLVWLVCELLWGVGGQVSFLLGTRLGPEPTLAQRLVCLQAESVLRRLKPPSQGCELLGTVGCWQMFHNEHPRKEP